MAYRILRCLISSGRKTTAEILDMADVYYAAGRISEAQYEEIVAACNPAEVQA